MWQSRKSEELGGGRIIDDYWPFEQIANTPPKKLIHKFQFVFMIGGQVPWLNSEQLVQDIDRLPQGAGWQAEELAVGEGRYARRHVLYKRPVIDVIRDLIGNPAFKDFMRRVYTARCGPATGGGGVRQVPFLFHWDPRGTIAPVIIASDKTQMTTMSGRRSAYPVYLTIGNISKDIRRKETKHTTVIIGYLPMDKFDDIPSDSLRTRMKGELLHCAMASIMEPLEEAGRSGVEMWCADGWQHRVYPLLAAFVGDWPKQNEMACTVQSGCPKCLKAPKRQGDERAAAARTRVSTLLAIDRFLETGRKRALSTLNLKPWWPWWANLPAAEFARCIAPDLLHQLHWGMIKGHAVKWIQRKLGKGRVDERFASMTRAQDLRHFKNGISTVEKWTGHEVKEMEKILLPIVAEHQRLPDDLVKFLRVLLNFCYIARAARMTNHELEELGGAYAEMHRLKEVLVSSGIYQGLGRLDGIPKWHMLSHYVDSICELGTPDGYNTESPEYLHIVYVKRGWDESNKREVIPQLIDYCQCLEALRIHRAYLNDYYGVEEDERQRGPRTTAVFVDDEEGEYDPGDPRMQGGEGGMQGEPEGESLDDVDEGADDDEEERGRRGPAGSDATGLEHPDPEFAIAVRPTRTATLQQLVADYGATSFERALRSFLLPYARSCYLILPFDDFSVWHKLTLYHRLHSFAPDEPLHRDVIRVRPSTPDAQTNPIRRCEPVFDTVLFIHNNQKIGLHRYRAGRVRAIFRLPERLRDLYPGELVYIETFNPFNMQLSDVHQMQTTSHAHFPDGTRQAIVIPIEHIVLGSCTILAPSYRGHHLKNNLCACAPQRQRHDQVTHPLPYLDIPPPYPAVRSYLDSPPLWPTHSTEPACTLRSPSARSPCFSLSYQRLVAWFLRPPPSDSTSLALSTCHILPPADPIKDRWENIAPVAQAQPFAYAVAIAWRLAPVAFVLARVFFVGRQTPPSCLSFPLQLDISNLVNVLGSAAYRPGRGPVQGHLAGRADSTACVRHFVRGNLSLSRLINPACPLRVADAPNGVWRGHERGGFERIGSRQ
ncbi:hypothetical protein BDV93DRAFT_511623 [Ceratobasidium sp. AG-I]|nr:hypothetical protein BDV93DRAFT_511623 [Ceratobasidium sp. AG-I]